MCLLQQRPGLLRRQTHLRLLAQVMGHARCIRPCACRFELGGHLMRLRPFARSLVKVQQRAPSLGRKRTVLQRTVRRLGPVEEACLGVVLCQGMLGAVAVGTAEVGT